MTDQKKDLISAVSAALDSGDITAGELQKILDSHSKRDVTQRGSATKTSAADIMFYITGIVFFVAVVALIAQSWDNGPVTRILLSGGIGVLSWIGVLALISLPNQGDSRRGLSNALLLSGSLLLITGGMIIANEYVDMESRNFLYALSATLALLGALHLSFGVQIKRILISLIGIFLAVSAFPSLIFGILAQVNTPLFVNWLVIAVSGGLIAYTTRVASWTNAGLRHVGGIFDSLSAFIVLLSLYGASFDKNSGLLWLFVMIAGIVGLFYLSIVLQSKLMLGNGSLFLVLAIVTISFRYFSDYGVPISLLIASLGLLVTAVVATTINRRYITSS